MQEFFQKKLLTRARALQTVAHLLQDASILGRLRAGFSPPRVYSAGEVNVARAAWHEYIVAMLETGCNFELPVGEEDALLLGGGGSGEPRLSVMRYMRISLSPTPYTTPFPLQPVSTPHCPPLAG
jgi:hypothetical protein